MQIAKMNKNQQSTLNHLYAASQSDKGSGLVDSADANSATLHKLQSLKLAKEEELGLWRITLRGIVEVRNLKKANLPLKERLVNAVHKKPGRYSTQIANEEGFGVNTVSKALTRLRREGRIKAVGEGTTKSPFLYYPKD